MNMRLRFLSCTLIFAVVALPVKLINAETGFSSPLQPGRLPWMKVGTRITYSISLTDRFADGRIHETITGTNDLTVTKIEGNQMTVHEGKSPFGAAGEHDDVFDIPSRRFVHFENEPFQGVSIFSYLWIPVGVKVGQTVPILNTDFEVTSLAPGEVGLTGHVKCAPGSVGDVTLRYEASTGVLLRAEEKVTLNPAVPRERDEHPIKEMVVRRTSFMVPGAQSDQMQVNPPEPDDSLMEVANAIAPASPDIWDCVKRCWPWWILVPYGACIGGCLIFTDFSALDCIKGCTGIFAGSSIRCTCGCLRISC